MIRSMTGYAQATAERGEVRVTVEVRSVNNRFADVRVKLPAELAAREADLRRRVLRKVRRGRVDLTLNLAGGELGERGLALNRTLLVGLTEAVRELRDEFGIDGDLDLPTLLSVPGVLELRDSTELPEEDQAAAINEAVEQALDGLDGERRREGETLRADLIERFRRMGELAERIAERAGVLPALLRQRLIERVEALSESVELDPARIAQEATFLIDRGDITEEVVRLRGHLAQAGVLLAEPDADPVGKRLDFLLQEIHRETNTINSKSPDLELSRHGLELKVETEKVREQVQNLE